MEALCITTHSWTGKGGAQRITQIPSYYCNKHGGKVLENFLTDRINDHLHSNSLLNKNQYGFLSQKSTVDDALVSKVIGYSHLQQRNYVIIISLDVVGAFDGAWWPSILGNFVTFAAPVTCTIWPGITFRIEWRLFTPAHRGRKGKFRWDAHKNPVVALDFGMFCTTPS